MIADKIAFDSYTYKARFQPALLATLPLGLATLSWFPNSTSTLGMFWGLVVWSGGAALLAQIGRDFGKMKEPNLFEKWGGKPTTWLLRHRNAPNRVLLTVRHSKLQALFQNVKIPDASAEEKDPSKADEVYENCVRLSVKEPETRSSFL